MEVYPWFLQESLLHETRTQKHIDLPSFSSLRVRYAAQVLSHSLYADITAMVTLKFLSDTALPTAHFAKQCDSLFNCSYSYSHKKKKVQNHIGLIMCLPNTPGITPSWKTTKSGWTTPSRTPESRHHHVWTVSGYPSAALKPCLLTYSKTMEWNTFFPVD